MKNLFTVFFITFSFNAIFSQNAYDIKVVSGTFLGNEQRNYYGNEAPDRLDIIWKLDLGEGVSPAYGYDKVWKGAGWTGQPLFIRENGKGFLILGAFDYNLKKIDAQTGKIVWEYKFDDILKGTATFWENKNETDLEKRYIIMQGSRFGVKNKITDEFIPSFRAISYLTGKELWRLNSKKTDCYSRDVDGSAVVVNDTAYLCLENGIFTVFNPNPDSVRMKDGMLQPQIYKEIQYYNAEDLKTHGDDVVSESSPTYFNGIVYTTSGSGHVYGHGISADTTVFDFFTGTDINGSAPVTDDSCLILPIEKQYTAGQGGVMKINPQKTGNDAVVWYYPTENKTWYHWEGGIIGSASVNDAYVEGDSVKVAVFIDVTGHLVVVEHNKIDSEDFSIGTDGKSVFRKPKVLFDYLLRGTISTPIIVKDKIIAATDAGVYLFKIDLKKKTLVLLDSAVKDSDFDATPIAVDGRIYLAGRNGYLYCFGKK
jgi:outer membrane protein assembly factor BamB